MGKLLLLLLFIFPCASRSQTRHLTTANGLPDNVAYQTLQDQQGFLWIATDQGVVRYDGQLMKVYAREQGVPDIEVMQLVMETCGRIWLRCYDNSVAFYDPVRNRFVSVSAYIALAGLGHVKRLRALEEGGLQIDLERVKLIRRFQRTL